MKADNLLFILGRMHRWGNTYPHTESAMGYCTKTIAPQHPLLTCLPLHCTNTCSLLLAVSFGSFQVLNLERIQAAKGKSQQGGSKQPVKTNERGLENLPSSSLGTESITTSAAWSPGPPGNGLFPEPCRGERERKLGHEDLWGLF